MLVACRLTGLSALEGALCWRQRQAQSGVESSDAKMTPDQITEAQRKARVPLPKMRP